MKEKFVVRKDDIYMDTKKTIQNDLSKYEKGYLGYHILRWLRSAKIRLKKSTYSNYQYVLNARLIPKFAQMKCRDINSDLIVSYTSELLEELSPKTVKDILIILQSIFTFSNINIKITMPKVPKHEIQILKKEEQETLEKYLLNNFNITNFGIYFCLYTGLRIGELCALKWENIDIKAKKITIKRTIIRIKDTDVKKKTKTTLIMDEPKSTSSIREIPIPDFLISMLKQFQSDPNNFLMTGTDQFIETRTLFNRYKRVLKKTHLKMYNFHALRHTFATRCIENGSDPKTLSEILGHANVKTTLDRYVHPNFDIKTKMMNTLVLMYHIKK